MNALEYVKGKDSLEDKEKFVYDTFNKLDKESFDLFNEIIDLSDYSYYKLMSLYLRTNKLASITKDTIEASNSLNKIEENSFSYATRRYQFKKLMVIFATMFSFLSSSILALLAYVVLSKKANKDYAIELESVYNAMEIVDEDKVKIITNTLQNCQRLLDGKERKILKHLLDSKDNEEVLNNLVLINETIQNYIDGNINYESINKMNDEFKNNLKGILMQDLNAEEEDLFNLLELAKYKNISSLKLIKDYQ